MPLRRFPIDMGKPTQEYFTSGQVQAVLRRARRVGLALRFRLEFVSVSRKGLSRCGGLTRLPGKERLDVDQNPLIVVLAVVQHVHRVAWKGLYVGLAEHHAKVRS